MVALPICKHDFLEQITSSLRWKLKIWRAAAPDHRAPGQLVLLIQPSRSPIPAIARALHAGMVWMFEFDPRIAASWRPLPPAIGEGAIAGTLSAPGFPPASLTLSPCGRCRPGDAIFATIRRWCIPELRVFIEYLAPLAAPSSMGAAILRFV